MAFAYLVAYPMLSEKTVPAIMWRDTAISGAAVLVAGMLYWGTDVRFSLFFFDTNWLVFSIVTLGIIEAPLFAWFVRRHNIKL